MDRNNHFLNVLSSIDETYLIAMSNKGTYKRAMKDLAVVSNVKMDVEEGAAQIHLDDGITVTFTGDIRSYSCSCEARSICKHVIMALLEAKKMYEGEENIKVDFSALLNVNVRNIVSEKMWAEMMFRETFQQKFVLEEEGALIATFPEENITVRFLTAESVADAICTCKAEGICRHKAEAVYWYQKEKGISHETKQMHPLIIAPDKLSIFKEMIEQIVHFGLTRLTENTIYEIEQLSVKARSLKLAKLENLFRKFGADIGLYRMKHASFQMASYRQTVSAIYEHILLLERHHLQESPFRSEYYEVPPLILHAFGASGWQTKSGYVGVTYYFYNREQEKWITYTQSRPMFYEGSSTTSEELHERQVPWGIAGKGYELSRSSIRLKQAKLNADFQLSSSSQTVGEVEGKTNVAEWQSLFLTSWEELLKKVKEQRLEANKQGIFCIEVAEIGEWKFQKQEQKWIIPLIDKNGKTLQMQMMKRPENERMIRLVKIYVDSLHIKRMLVHPYQEGTKLVVTPIILYTEAGEIINTTLSEGGTFYDRVNAPNR
ncbi:SWIM zinc finger family protein [Bacillus cereus group sp. N21]|uniref:SWIM zinc finger family protein n=1 Tax=Bacillus cereus group sp. N21 TaxID=2794591 RepID=UPI0018F5F8A6|nr:SWIM zinc finger family protein [Bacillus cereus group sp. N21]MBJ8030044.1 SWIM zinc finger family protein [Bacillus cereus group sp. N21]